MKDLRRALAKGGRDGVASPLVAIEGPILIAEALRSGLRIECVFADQDLEPSLRRLKLPTLTDILLFPRQILTSSLTTETPQPIAALVEAPRWTWEQALRSNTHQPALLLVLAGLQDPGNLGTILRSAEAFGATGVISLPGTVIEWNPKSSRASAGSVFRMPILHATAEDAFTRLRHAGFRILAATAREALPAHATNLTSPIAFIIGNEGNGIPLELAARSDGAITIPCPGPVESLNAAVATSLLLYEAARQRALHKAPKGNSR